jgi:carboxylesterase
LRLAELRGAEVRGLVLVNPSLLSENRALKVLPVLRYAVPSLKGIANDIKKAGSTELAYDRMSLQALHSLTNLWSLTRKDLAQVTQPLLVFRSVEDHVVEASNTAAILAGVSSTETEERLLEDSYHVATLDNDAPLIFDGSLDFVRRHAGTTLAAGGG